MVPDATRRAVLRAGSAAVGAGALLGRAEGSAESGASTATDANGDEQTATPDQRYTGYVFHPERGTFLDAIAFRLVVRFDEAEASVGRGDAVCERPRQAYVPYGIEYLDPERTTAFLAVPLTDDQRRLPDEGYVPRTVFRFVASDGTYVFQAACDAPRTPVQRAVFAPVS